MPWSKIRNIILQSAIADNPAVMTAGGWKVENNGKVVNKETEGSKLLLTILPIIGLTGLAGYGLPPLLTNPIARNLIKAGLEGYIGSESVNKGLQLTTGKTWGENLREGVSALGISAPWAPEWLKSTVAEATNPGGFIQLKNINLNLLKNSDKLYIEWLKNIGLDDLVRDHIITPEEALILKNTKINYKKGYSSNGTEITLDKSYTGKDGGYSLFHELGHILGIRRGDSFLNDFYSKNIASKGNNYKYSSVEDIIQRYPEINNMKDKLNAIKDFIFDHNKNESFADFIGFKIGGNKSLAETPGISVLGRWRAFKSLGIPNEELMGIPKHNRIGNGDFRTFVNRFNNMGTIDVKNSTINGSNFGKFLGEGSEQIVYENTKNPNTVLKIYNDIGHSNYKSLNLFNKTYLTRNNVPFSAQSSFIGYVKDSKGLMYPVYELTKVNNILNKVSKEDWLTTHLPNIRKQLAPLGFNDRFIRNNQIINDLLPGNVGLNNGKYTFIDIDPIGFKRGGKI